MLISPAYIRAVRLQTLQSFLRETRAHIDTLTTNDPCSAAPTPPSPTPSECTLLNLGSTLRQLHGIGLSPAIWVPNGGFATEILDSVATIAAQLTTLRIAQVRDRRHDSTGTSYDNIGEHGGSVLADDLRHEGCDSGTLLANRISKVVVGIEDCVSVRTRDQMRMNAGKCGTELGKEGREGGV